MALEFGLEKSDYAFAVRHKEHGCLGIFGVMPSSPGVGIPWFLCSAKLFEEARVSFLRRSRTLVEAMQLRYPVLFNHVHKDNAVARRWLEWCGFRLGPASQTFGPCMVLISRTASDA